MAGIEIPPYFICPISLEMMKDPVIISTGITYDRDSIEKWIFSQENATCPVTRQHLSDADITPNITLRRLIQSWCTLHESEGITRVPTPKEPITKSQLLKLFNDAECSQKQTNCLIRLKSIASQNHTNKKCMQKFGAPEFLAKFVVKKTLEASLAGECEDIAELICACEVALNILYALQLSESSLESIGNVEFVESLIRVMQFGSFESRAYAIMLLESILNVTHPNQIIVALRHEFFAQCVQILNDELSQKATKATLKVLIKACQCGRNRVKAVEAGAVAVLIDLLLDSSDRRGSELMLMLLDILCQCAEGRSELLNHSAGLAVVSKKILRISQLASDAAVRILQSISKFCSTAVVLQEMLQIGVASKLCLVLQVDCAPKTKERAGEMLRLHARVWKNPSCIPTHLICSYPS